MLRRNGPVIKRERRQLLVFQLPSEMFHNRTNTKLQKSESVEICELVWLT